MEVKKLWVHLSRAEIITILETALPKSMTEKYAFPYIHVLRVIPMRNANLDKIWQQVSAAENTVDRQTEQFETLLRQIESDILSRIEVLFPTPRPSFIFSSFRACLSASASQSASQKRNTGISFIAKWALHKSRQCVNSDPSG